MKMAADGEHGVASEKQDVDNSDENIPHKESYTIEVLHIIKEAQQAHGLRHGDFQRYRQYCARRIRRIRKSLHFLQGTRHKVQPKKVTEEAILKDARYLYLPLIDAERSWAYAMQLKSEANTEPRKRFHMMSRLKKAVVHAQTLAELCENDKCDARTKLEAQAYCSWMKGSLHFELENWKSAMELFNKTRTIYEKLSSAFVDEIKEVYEQRVQELVPNIRYCAYNIGDESAMEDLRQMRIKTGGKEDAISSRLDELIEKTREKQSATLSEVTWRGRTVPVKNEQVRGLLLSVQESERQLTEADTVEGKLSICETLLKELIDAQQSLRDELKEDPVFKAIIRGQQQVEEKVPNTVYLHTYLQYLKQTKTIQRNLLMIASLKQHLPAHRTDDSKKVTKPQDLARLYDIICQNLSEIPNLPGVEEEDELSQDVEAQIVGYKAFRCFYLAQTCQAAKKYKEAIALFEQVITYCKDAVQDYKNLSRAERFADKVRELEELHKEVDGLKYSVHASSILDVDDMTDHVKTLSIKNKVPLCDRLDEYVEDAGLTSKKPSLVHFPPEFQPVPAKPLFFDLALSQVEFPPLDEKLEQKKQQGGLTGFVKGWLGGWGGAKK